MEQRALGRSGLRVPVVGMGTWKTFDVRDAEEVASRKGVVDTALRVGSNLFDSSPMYGAAEEVLGSALNGRRERAMVATKVWTPDDREAQRQVQRALGWFGGHVEVYQVHNLVAWQTRLTMLERLRDQGQVQCVGITHYDQRALPDMLDIMRSGRVTAIQIPYSVRERAVEREVLAAADDLGIGVIVMRPLGQGALAVRAPSPEALQPLEAFGVRTWAQALLKWIVSDSRVTTAIPATTSQRHAEENAAVGEPPWFGSDERAYVERLAERI